MERVTGDAGVASVETEEIVKYVILLYDAEAAKGMTEAEGQQWYAEIGAWYEKGGGGSGKLAEGGHQLAPPAYAFCSLAVRFDSIVKMAS